MAILSDYELPNVFSSREQLDQYVTDRQGNPLPAIMMEFTSHSMWVNSKALELAGIDESVQDDPDRGMIYMRDPATGKLNGIVLENAGIAIMEHAYDITVGSFVIKSCL